MVVACAICEKRSESRNRDGRGKLGPAKYAGLTLRGRHVSRPTAASRSGLETYDACTLIFPFCGIVITHKKEIPQLTAVCAVGLISQVGRGLHANQWVPALKGFGCQVASLMLETDSYFGKFIGTMYTQVQMAYSQCRAFPTMYCSQSRQSRWGISTTEQGPHHLFLDGNGQHHEQKVVISTDTPNLVQARKRSGRESSLVWYPSAKGLLRQERVACAAEIQTFFLVLSTFPRRLFACLLKAQKVSLNALHTLHSLTYLLRDECLAV